MIRIWCLLRDQHGHVKPVEDYFGDRAEFFYDEEWEPDRVIQSSPDLVLCVNDFHYDVVRCIDAARQHYIPSLVLQDGILEWRCQFENPAFGAGGGAPQHQPVIADKIACIGFQSARQIAAWGNVHKVEVTGMPRMDFLQGTKLETQQGGKKRILVMTAKKPGFTPDQTKRTLDALSDIKQYLETQPDIEVVWRVTKQIDRDLQVTNQLQELSSKDLVSVLCTVDAVISTPSTAMLEAMLLQRPVACLDYHNVPRFVQTAWTISSSTHIHNVITELLSPPTTKLIYQQEVLADTLFCGKATERVALLITKMITHAKELERSKTPMAMPPNMLGFSLFATEEHQFPLTDLYPTSDVFRINDLQELQVRLARIEKDYSKAKEQLRSRSATYWLYVVMRHLTARLKQRNIV